MKDEKLERLLGELTDATRVSPRPGLADDIKSQIPANLLYHKSGLDSFNIMIDLKISKLAAAAIIIVTLILSASYFGAADSSNSSFFQDGRAMVRYVLKGEKAKTNIAAGSLSNLYETLVQKGKDVVCYDTSPGSKDNDAILMQWKVADDKYSVVLADLSVKTVTAEELVKLQAKMLQKKTK